MSYEARLKHRELVDRAAALRERLDSGDDEARLTREEGRELAALVEELVVQLRPERWDDLMETVAAEAARRAGVVTVMK